ncbi:MAG: hypothetical protein EBR86_16900 [Planctomycetia bacterium]|nr:hypothetical protein [Planctomycetia bacterium]
MNTSVPPIGPVNAAAQAALDRQAQAVLAAGRERAERAEAAVRGGTVPDGAVCHAATMAPPAAPQPGTTAKFGTGAVRSNEVEDLRYDLITPIGLREVARAYAEGAKKYGDFNWEKGMPVHDLLNHAIAHIYRFLEGDRSEPHLGHAGWNLLAAIHSHEAWPQLNAGTLRGPGCVRPSDDRSGASQAPAKTIPTQHELRAMEDAELSDAQIDEMAALAARYDGPNTPTYQSLARANRRLIAALRATRRR